MRICLGGSFNPVHHGHLICARAAMEAVKAEGVVLILTAQPPHKPQIPVAPAADRLEMCRLAISNIDGFSVNDCEIRRGGPSYTIDTARDLRRAGWDSVTWLIGADMLNILPAWRSAPELIAEVNFLIMARPGWAFDWGSLPGEFQKLRGNIVPTPLIDISSTEIRRRAAAGLPIDFLTPPAVCRYITDRRLYR